MNKRTFFITSLMTIAISANANPDHDNTSHTTYGLLILLTPP